MEIDLDKITINEMKVILYDIEQLIKRSQIDYQNLSIELNKKIEKEQKKNDVTINAEDLGKVLNVDKLDKEVK